MTNIKDLCNAESQLESRYKLSALFASLFHSVTDHLTISASWIKPLYGYMYYSISEVHCYEGLNNFT